MASKYLKKQCDKICDSGAKSEKLRENTILPKHMLNWLTYYGPCRMFWVDTCSITIPSHSSSTSSRDANIFLNLYKVVLSNVNLIVFHTDFPSFSW